MTNALRLTRLEPPEHAIQDAVLRYLALDRRVAWAHRFNAGAQVIDEAASAKAALLDRYAGKLYAARHNSAVLAAILLTFLRAYFAIRKGARRYLRFAFPGCSDILGQLASGHFLAVEVKRPSTKTTPEQAVFLAQINAAGGLGLVARSVDDVQAALDRFEPLQQQNAA